MGCVHVHVHVASAYMDVQHFCVTQYGLHLNFRATAPLPFVTL